MIPTLNEERRSVRPSTHPSSTRGKADERAAHNNLLRSYLNQKLIINIQDHQNNFRFNQARLFIFFMAKFRVSMLERVKSGELDHCMDDIWVEIQRQEVNKYKLSEHQQPPKSTPTTSTETDEIKPEIPSHNPSTVEQSENQPPPPTEEVVQFVNDLNSWQDPYDVPPTVWTVSSGLGANLRGMPSVAKVVTGPRRPGAVGRPRKRPLHPVRADLSNRLSMKSPEQLQSPAVAAPAETTKSQVEDNIVPETAEPNIEDNAKSAPKRSLATSELEIDEDESTSEAAEEDNESDVSSSASSTKCMTTSDAEEWLNMPESHFKQERRRQQEVMKLIKDPEDVSIPRLTSPKRKSGPTSPVRTPIEMLKNDVKDDVPLARFSKEAKKSSFHKINCFCLIRATPILESMGLKSEGQELSGEQP
ncbi:hypothetical protein ACTXT7_007781 [Hymenolepis weldensis]